jgi:hypothetical protein
MQGGFSGAQGSVIPYLGIRYLLDGPGWSELEPDHADQFAAARSAALAIGQIYPVPVADNGAAWHLRYTAADESQRACLGHRTWHHRKNLHYSNGSINLNLDAR